MASPPPPKRRLSDLESHLGHTFTNRALLNLAVTHRSSTNETGETEHNERLEFLGDAILQLILSELLYEHFLDADEGELSRLRASAVNRDSLAERARGLGVGDALRLGAGERRSGGAQKSSLLADAYEAIIAAIHLDAGYLAAKAFVVRAFDIPGLQKLARDPKTDLQQHCQKTLHQVPSYRVVSETGPEHDPSFRVEAMLGDRVLGQGEGKSKKTAEQAAATAALSALEGTK